MRNIFYFYTGAVAALAFSTFAYAVGETNPTGVAGSFNGEITTAGSYDALTGSAKRVIEDIDVPGAVGAYGLKWKRSLNTRGFGSIGGRGSWAQNYEWNLWVRIDDGKYHDPPYEGPDGHLDMPDGSSIDLWDGDGYGTLLVTATDSRCGVIEVVKVGTGAYDARLPDGGRVHFTGTQSGMTVMTLARSITDPYGQTTTLTYDTSNRLIKVTEPAGRYLQINRAAGNGAINSVQAYDGQGNLTQTVTYNYSTLNLPNSYGPAPYLTQVDYDDGAHAYYTYQSGNVLDQTAKAPGIIKTCVDPRFAGPMKQIEYEFVTGTNNPPFAYGQIKAEKNFTTHQVVSQITYPSYPLGQFIQPTDMTQHRRTETRGDGSTRAIHYGDAPNNPNGWLSSYTDFKGQWFYDSGYLIEVSTDARGNTTTIQRTVGGEIASVQYPGPDHATATWNYDQDVYLISHTDENGHITYYDRDASHRVSQIRHPDGSAEQFTYNGFGQVLTHTLSSGGVETVEYDPRGRKTASYPPATESDPNPAAHKTLYFYYESGAHTDRLQRVQDPRLNSTTYEYNLRGQVTKVTHPDGSYTQSSYNLDGTLAWAEDELAHRTSYIYDEYKRVLTVTNALNQTTTNSYALDWNNPLLHTTSNVKYTLSPMNKNVVFDYDENLRKIHQIVALGTTADEAWTYYGYDAVGNLNWTQDPRGKISTFGFDERNRKTSATDPLNQVTQWQYDAVGNKTKEIRPDNSFRSWDYDSMNRMAHAYDWRFNEQATSLQTVTYDRNPTPSNAPPNAARNVIGIIDQKGAVYSYAYDALNRKILATYPLDANNIAQTEGWHYDFAGNMDRYKNPDGKYRHTEYDCRNRARHSYWNQSGATVSVQDCNATATAGSPDSEIGPDVRTEIDVANRVTSIVTNSGGTADTTISYGYDLANRKVDETETVAGFTPHIVHTDYDADGNREHVRAGWDVYHAHYTYTQRNQVKTVGDGNGSGDGVWFSFTYDPAGNMTLRQNWTGRDQMYSYRDDNRIEMIESRSSSGAYAHSWYQYDVNGREAQTWRDDGRGEQYHYEPGDQIQKVVYDAFGVQNGGTPTGESHHWDYGYTPDKLNRAGTSPSQMNQYTSVAGQTLHYDNNFNLYQYGALSYTYNAANQMTWAYTNGVAHAIFKYDGLGRCVLRHFDGVSTIYVYDEWSPLLEYDASNNFLAWNLYGPQGVDDIIMRASYTYLHFYHKDNRGSITGLFDGNGTGLESYHYDAFGWPYVKDWNGGSERSASTCDNRFMFTGREFFPILGLYDYRHRWYDPWLGNFRQIDPSGFDAGDMNLFRYCGEDPVDRTDPTGLYTTSALTMFGGGQWAWDNGGIEALAQLEQQQQRQAAGNEGLAQAAGGTNIAYVTYGGNWTEADVKGFNQEVADDMADPARRAVWEAMYADPRREYRISPNHATGGFNIEIAHRTIGAWLRDTLFGEASAHTVIGAAQGSGNFERNPRGDNTAANQMARRVAQEEGLPEKYWDHFHDAVHERTLEYGRALTRAELQFEAQQIRNFYRP